MKKKKDKVVDKKKKELFEDESVSEHKLQILENYSVFVQTLEF